MDDELARKQRETERDLSIKVRGDQISATGLRQLGSQQNQSEIHASERVAIDNGSKGRRKREIEKRNGGV